MQREEESAMLPACTVSLDFGLESDIDMLRNTVRTFAAEKIAPCATGLDWTSGSPTAEVQLVQGKLADLYTHLNASQTYVCLRHRLRPWPDYAQRHGQCRPVAAEAASEIRSIRSGRDLFKEAA
jgi:hypothetical protein